MDTFTMKILTITAAIGSSTRQSFPRKIAPAIPKAVPIDEKASER